MSTKQNVWVFELIVEDYVATHISPYTALIAMWKDESQWNAVTGYGVENLWLSSLGGEAHAEGEAIQIPEELLSFEVEQGQFLREQLRGGGYFRALPDFDAFKLERIKGENPATVFGDAYMVFVNNILQEIHGS